MPHHRVRAHPGRLPHRRQRHHHRPQHRLHHLHPLQPGAPAAPASTSPRSQSTYGASAARTRPAAPRTPARPPPAPRPSPPTGRPDRGTRTPSGPRPRRHPGHHPGRGLPGRHRRQPRHQLLPVRAGHHRPVLERRPGRRQRPPHIGRVQLRAGPPRARPAAPPAPPGPPPIRPDTSHATASRRPAAGLAGPGSRRWPSAAGPPPGSTCALVPLIPNEDTPARRGRPSGGHGTGSASSRTAPGRPVHVRRRLGRVQRRRQHLVLAAPAPS